ncbi:MAG: (Fe-S)-binding protein [Candidatus Bathyarchaeia archaeon]
MVLEKYKNSIFRCTRCGTCREKYTENVRLVCPIREVTGGFEHYFARGRVLIARGILEGALKYSTALVESVYTCLGCSNCVEQCGAIDMDTGRPLVDTPAIIRAMRQDIVRAELGPLPTLKEVDSNVEKTRNPFGEALEKRAAWSAGLSLPKRGDTIYFAGCYASYRFPKTAKATVNILREGGINAVYLGENEWCCGVPELWDGNIALAEEVIKHNVDAIKSAGAKRVVTSCAGCYHALNTDYLEIMGQLPFEVVHISEIIADLTEKGKIKLPERIEKTLTYHDPCHLGRFEKVYDPPRKALSAIDGAKLVEMVRNKENAWCCGGGSVVYVAFPDLTAEIAKDRVSEAKEAGAEAIVTACPLCVTVLTPAARRAGIEVYDLPVIVAKAMGLKI